MTTGPSQSGRALRLIMPVLVIPALVFLLVAATVGAPLAQAAPAAAPAAPVTIDFESLSPPFPSGRYDGHTEDGYTISQNTGGEIRVSGFPPNNIFLYAADPIGGGVLTITKSDATSFSFAGLDIDCGNCATGGDPHVIIRGYVGGVSGTLVGVDDIQMNLYTAGPLEPWAAINLAGRTVDTLTIEMTVTPNEPGQPIIDNIVLNNAPLAVTLAGFDATAQAGHVLVTWQTVSEIGNTGFNLYRTTSEQAPTASDLLASIPSQAPGSTQGFAYAYQDNAVTAGETYWYWLEDVDLSGATTLHGPVSVVFTAPTAVTLSGLEAAADRPALAWPVAMALLAAVLAAGLAVWRRHNAAA